MVSGSLLSGGRERNWIVFIVPFEVTIPCERPRYPHIPAVNHEDGGKPKKGRVRKGNCLQDNGSPTGQIPKPRGEITVKEGPRVNDQGGAGSPKPEEQIN